mgnify:CR=1 FL=1
MRPMNLLFIMSDQHSRGVTGCYGNRFVKTPVLDRLAAAGTVFENAYSPSPRAALATGRQVDALLGQCIALYGAGAELGPPAAGRRPARRIDWQASLSQRT